MGSELDRRFDAVMDALTAPGAPLETEPFERGGVAMRTFKAAPATLPALFARYCAQHSDAEFLVEGNVRLTFGQTHALAIRLAAGLIARHGVAKGDRVGLAARNSVNWVIAYMGIIIAGGCATLLNGWWSGEELEAGIALAECKLVLADPQRTARLEGHCRVGRLVTFDHGQPEAGLAPVLAAQDAAQAFPDLTADDLATILFTSGSTGVSKGAVSDHRAVVHATLNYAAQSLMVLTHLAQSGELPGDQPSALVGVPLFHVTGEVPLFLQSFALGRKLVILPKWDALEAMRLIESERIGYFVGVPLMSFEIATHPERHRFDLASCAYFAAGGAPRPPEHVSRIRKELPGSFPLLGYGLTETNGVGCGNFNENYLAKPESTGPASRPLVELAIFDETGRALPAGQTGEVAIRSVANFLGYWNNPEATAEAIRPDGFFLSGDLGYLDADGYLYIVDRLKDVIIRGGENIACLEVEQVLYAHPGLAEACVFGLPHDHYGEVPVAVYRARAGHDLGEDELRLYVAERIAGFKVPVRLWREPGPLPRLGSEKIDKRALKARYAEGWSTAMADG